MNLLVHVTATRWNSNSSNTQSYFTVVPPFPPPLSPMSLLFGAYFLIFSSSTSTPSYNCFLRSTRKVLFCSHYLTPRSFFYIISHCYYPILSYSILFYPILSYPILSYPILSYPILSYPILSYTVLFYPILFYSILSYSILFYSLLFIFGSLYPLLF